MRNGKGLCLLDGGDGIGPAVAGVRARTRDSHIDDAVVLRNRHAIVVRLVASQIHRVALDTCRAVKVETVSHSSVVTFVDADRTILQVPINIDGRIPCACNDGWVDKKRTVYVVQYHVAHARISAFYGRVCACDTIQIIRNIVALVAPYNAVSKY